MVTGEGSLRDLLDPWAFCHIFSPLSSWGQWQSGFEEHLTSRQDQPTTGWKQKREGTRLLNGPGKNLGIMSFKKPKWNIKENASLNRPLFNDSTRLRIIYITIEKYLFLYSMACSNGRSFSRWFCLAALLLMLVVVQEWWIGRKSLSGWFRKVWSRWN